MLGLWCCHCRVFVCLFFFSIRISILIQWLVLVSVSAPDCIQVCIHKCVCMCARVCAYTLKARDCRSDSLRLSTLSHCDAVAFRVSITLERLVCRRSARQTFFFCDRRLRGGRGGFPHGKSGRLAGTLERVFECFLKTVLPKCD